MKLYKKADRNTKTQDFLRIFKDTGFATQNIGEWKKWKELPDGRLSVSMTVYEIKKDDQVQGYILSDTLQRVACPITLDKQEVMDWLKEKGYKTAKEWYLQDYGMTEEAWEEWNK